MTPEATLAKLRRLNDKITAATLMVHKGAAANLNEWSGRPDPPVNAGEHLATDPTTGAVTFGDDEGNPIDYADPTGELAGIRLDIHGYALREIDRILKTDSNDLDELLDHLRMGLSTRQAEEIKASLPAACKSCARLTDHQGRRLYSPVHARGLCDWCDNFDRDWDQWAPEKILRAHHDGRRISRRMIERALSTKQVA